jgi:anti-sigma B factor antagonist
MPMPELEIRFQELGPRVMLVVSGDIDMATVGALRDALERAVAVADEVWVDLSGVEFMDSTGLTALVTTHHELNFGRGSLTVICPRGPVLRSLEVSGLHHVLHVRDAA